MVRLSSSQSGVLNSVGAEGSVEANLAKSGKRKSTSESRKDEFDTAFEINKCDDGSCDFQAMCEYLGIAARTVQDRLKEFKEEYFYAKNKIYRKK